MGRRLGHHWQIVLVGLLFLASLAMLLSSSLAAFQLPQYEAEMQKRLIAASSRMALAAAPLLDNPDEQNDKKTPGEWHPRLARITAEALADLYGVEGGFYFRGEWTGFAFPNPPHAPPEHQLTSKPPSGKKDKKDKSKHSPHLEGSSPPKRRDPPPNERDLIYAQCKESLNAGLGAPPVAWIREIPPSRILVVTEAVGRQPSPEVATWVMTRLTRPENMAADLRRYLISAILALSGIVVSLLLTINLGRNLRRERQQREQLREELRRAEHFAALGKMLAGVAHEVRNPLAAIRSTVQLFQRLPPSRDPSVLDTILQNVDRLNALVSRLLYFARSGHEERRPLDLNAIVQETLILLRAQAESQSVDIRTEFTPDLPLLLGSAQALQQVVLNLATNALQAMPKTGTLLCRTRCAEPSRRIELWIADTGPGIAEEELPHLFEPFHTSRPEGTGLGLALCREIVQQYGGQIELGHLDGWGAVFRVTIPMRPAS